jgi:hypothetical protein
VPFFLFFFYKSNLKIAAIFLFLNSHKDFYAYLSQ